MANDLVGGFERVNSIYRKYIESAFPLRYEALAEERRALLGEQGLLSQPPLLEPMPVYRPAKRGEQDRFLREACMDLPADYRDLEVFARKLFEAGDPPEQVPLYEHQWRSLESVVKDGRDIVVTTGTGSGKTECFLLPILAELARESRGWPACNEPPTARKWWEQRGGERTCGQWSHTRRPHAVRAMILYPLNALVEDQLRRLRRTLDSTDFHTWLDRRPNPGNRILFGRYTGQTPVSGRKEKLNGEPNKTALEKLRKRLREATSEWTEIRREFERGNIDEDILNYFANMDGGEMWSRWDMQETPPDILITNYSMLNIMLMRSLEEPIFDKTKAWLAADRSHRFSLIIDELHAYRGTPGTEVAYILRLLFQRLGLDERPDQLRILATSASVDENETSKKFLREIFGRDRFDIINPPQAAPDRGTYDLLRTPDRKAAFAAFARAAQPDGVFRPMASPDPTSCGEAMSQLAAALGRPKRGNEEAAVALALALQGAQVPEALRDTCAELNTTADGRRQVRATVVPRIDEFLFGPRPADQDICASEPMRGLALALSMSVEPRRKSSPQPVRAHLFFHNLQNLWACVNPRCSTVDLAARARIGDPLPIGALHPRHQIACTCGARVLDLIICEVCGEVFLGGYRKAGANPEILTADQPDLDGIPERTVLDRDHGHYAIFWPAADAPTPDDYSAKTADDRPSRDRRWRKGKLNCFTGVLLRNARPAQPDDVEGWVYIIGGSADGSHLREPAFPVRCPRCDADYRYHKKIKTPLRNHRTGFQKACQVIATALVREMPEVRRTRRGHSVPARKLVIFSDSRQDAAKLAAGIERDHFRDLVRIALISAQREFFDAILSYLKDLSGSIPALLDKIRTLNAGLADAIVALPQANVELANQFQQQNQDLTNETFNWALNRRPVNLPVFERLRQMIRDYPGLVAIPALRDRVWATLLELSQCPAGTRLEALEFSIAEGNRSRRLQWYDCFDWSGDQPVPLLGRADELNEHRSNLRSLLMGEVMYALFPHRARSFEGLGQGRVTIRYGEPAPRDEHRQATDAVIRLLGVRRHYLYAEYFDPGNNEDFPKYAEHYLLTTPVALAVAAQLLQGAQAFTGGRYHGGLNPEHLFLVPPMTPLDAEGRRTGLVTVP
jgi:DEAD/DEAH box helicase domain-containing protein